jgi:hypothetical protein
MKRMLIQTQLSNYDSNGKFILECDSGWQMVMGRVRQMLKLVPDLEVDVMGPVTAWMEPEDSCVVTDPLVLNKDLFDTGRVHYKQHWIRPNALETRYAFDSDGIASALDLSKHKGDISLRYDVVYINDPMHLRNFKALFHIYAGYQPKFVVHSHFIDNPSCPKFPKEASLWLGQCEAAIRADVNFWQCESSMQTFFKEMSDFFKHDVVEYTRNKSDPWDDGYSQEEIQSPVDRSKVRFDENAFHKLTEGKTVLFVPNRIGGLGRSSDYTNCGKFMFETLPKLRACRQDFIVIAGNPSQKILNSELEQMCGPNGYVSLVPDAFNRDEFKLLVQHYVNIAVGLYDQDTYGGTAARECVDSGCMPLWLDNYEYSSIAREADRYPFLAPPDMKDLHFMADALIHHFQNGTADLGTRLRSLQRVVRKRCSYEETSRPALVKMGLIT